MTSQADERLRLPQSILLLSQRHGRSLEPDLMLQDPFYCLLEILAFSVAAECNVLNLIESKVTTCVESIEEGTPAAVSNAQDELMFFQHLLEKHVRKVFELSRFVEDNVAGRTYWTIVVDNPNIKVPKERLSKDIDYLLRAMETLRERCSREMSTMMSLAGIREGKRGFESGRRTFKVTVLAAIFVPLSFSCSIFGMNFVDFDQKAWGYGIWISVSFVTCLATLLAIIGNEPATWSYLRRALRSVRERAVHDTPRRPSHETV
jgi:Mg2+ and Co2+ transporter CorA